jgi:hypothetical protein
MAFTIVFEGNIQDMEENPMKVVSPFGKPIASGTGNAFDKIEHLIDVEEAAEVLLQAIRKNLDNDPDDPEQGAS